MAPSRPARTTPRRVRARRARGALLVVLAALAAALAQQSLAPSAAPSPRSAVPAPAPAPADLDVDVPRPERNRVPGEADGALPDGTTVFDDAVPGVAGLDPGLLAALRRAAIDAAEDGVGFVVESGRRSPEYQARLLREAVAEHGSEAEAARWVATPGTSAHVSGDAVDIAPAGAREWLPAHGAAYGLCRVYDNEPWHFELRPDAVGDGCPPTYPDPTYDPRLSGASG